MVAVHADEIHEAMEACEGAVARFNRWLGGKITTAVATLWCAYAFALLALVSLPAVLASHSLLNIVAWVAQTFLQLVLLAIILFGQNLAAEKSDARAEATFQNSEEAEAALREILAGVQSLQVPREQEPDNA